MYQLLAVAEILLANCQLAFSLASSKSHIKGNSIGICGVAKETTPL
jgi:hypothetical protein